MNADDLAAAHVVRVNRNGIAHGNAVPVAVPLSLADCQRGLGRYLRWLPPRW
jgi:hypothetical protein